MTRQQTIDTAVRSSTTPLMRLMMRAYVEHYGYGDGFDDDRRFGYEIGNIRTAFARLNEK